LGNSPRINHTAILVPNRIGGDYVFFGLAPSFSAQKRGCLIFFTFAFKSFRPISHYFSKHGVSHVGSVDNEFPKDSQKAEFFTKSPLTAQFQPFSSPAGTKFLFSAFICVNPVYFY
jgi:hypothetical protein